MIGLIILPMLIALHTSDFTRGPDSEVTQDFIGAGLIVDWKDLEFEGALGYKSTNCKLPNDCGDSPGGYASLKWIIGGRPR